MDSKANAKYKEILVLATAGRVYMKTNSNWKQISTHLVSQGLAVKAYGLDVRAPTGQRSITFPDNSDLNIFST